MRRTALAQMGGMGRPRRGARGAAAVVNPFAGIAAGQAANYSGNNLMSAEVSPNPALSTNSPLTNGQWLELYPGGNNSTIFTGYSGGFYDSLRNRLVVFGNGHADNYGNEGYAWTASDQLWMRLNNPDLLVGGNTDGDDGYLNGTSRPSARHTYNGLCYLANVDRYFLSGSAVGPNTSGPGLFWLYNPANDSWVELPQSEDGHWSNHTNCAAYDPTSGRLFIMSRYALFSIDPTNTGAGWTKHVVWNSYGYDWTSAYRTMVIDHHSRTIVAIGNNELWVFDVANLAAGAATWTQGTTGWSGAGLAAALNTYGAGFTYDSLRQQVVGWNGGTTIYVMDLSAKTVITETIGGDTIPAATDGGSGPTGIYGRFQFIEAFGVFLAVSGYRAGAFQPVSVFKRAA